MKALDVNVFLDIVRDQLTADKHAELGADIRCAQVCVMVALAAFRSFTHADPDVATVGEAASAIYPMLRPYFRGGGA